MANDQRTQLSPIQEFGNYIDDIAQNELARIYTGPTGAAAAAGGGAAGGALRLQSLRRCRLARRPVPVVRHESVRCWLGDYHLP